MMWPDSLGFRASSSFDSLESGSHASHQTRRGQHSTGTGNLQTSRWHVASETFCSLPYIPSNASTWCSAACMTGSAAVLLL